MPRGNSLQLASTPRSVRWLTTQSLRHPGRTVLIWCLAALLALPGLLQLKFETNASSLLNRAGPAWSFYQQSLTLFGGDEIIVVALEGRRPFDPEVLTSLRRISEQIESIQGVRRVDSLSTVPIVRGTPDGALHLEPALDSEPINTPADVVRIREAVAIDLIAPKSLVSDNGRVFAINVLLEGGAEIDRVAIMHGIQEATAREHAWISGVPVFETEIGPRTQREILLFVPITLALMALLLIALFRSTYAVFVPLATGAMAAHFVLATMGTAGEPLTIIGILLPSIIIALGCAYVMHALTAIHSAQTREERHSAILNVGAPTVLSGLTTILGFLAMAIIDIDAIRGLGTYGALGVWIVLLGTLTFAPALIELRPRSIKQTAVAELLQNNFAGALIRFVERRRTSIIFAWGIATAICCLGLYQVHIETDATRWWPVGSDVRDDYEGIRERLSGISPMNIVLRHDKAGRFADPEVVARIDQFSSYLNSLPHIGKAVSIASPLRQLHGGFVGDASYPVPDGRQLIAQYLLLLDSVEHIDDLISSSHDAANILLRIDNNGSRHLLEIAAAAEAWWDEFGIGDIDAQATGIMFEFARSEDAIALGQLQGLGLALTAIALTLFVLFQDLRVVAIALVPNLLPLIVIFGALGLLGMPLDAGTACLGSLALGIAVDDTIHVMLDVRRHQRSGSSAVLLESYRTVLTALVYTSVVVAVGFGVIGFSEFTLTRNLGWVTSVIVTVCLIADITLLPALLMSPRISGLAPQRLATVQESE